MKQALLLRSFGDFVIALYHMPPEEAANASFSLIASKHLESLHKALSPYLSPSQQSIRFIDLQIRHHIFAGFTNRYFFSKDHWKELKSICAFVKGEKENHIYLEQASRSWLIKWACSKKIDSIHKSGNIYDSWAGFYNHVQPNSATIGNYKQVLIFPDSRLARKKIPEASLLQLESNLKASGKQTDRAYFGAQGSDSYQHYHNFEELIALILKADFMISSDSLPAHLAQLLGKPHAILYAKKINTEWVTPFARAHQKAFTFDEINKIHW